MATAFPVLTFHALDDRASVISVAPPVFGRGLALLHARQYRAVRLAEAVAALRARAPLPDRAFALTFDDGFQSVYTEAFPLLAGYSMSATVFLATGAEEPRASGGRLPPFEGRPRLSWTEIREMHRAGIEFGAHTLTHPDLTRLSEAEIAREMTTSRDRIEQALGAPVQSFAYPFGRYDARCRRLAERHFACACADTLGLVSMQSDPHALERVDAYYLRTHRLFALTVTASFSWYVAARNVPRRLRRAVQRRLGA